MAANFRTHWQAARHVCATPVAAPGLVGACFTQRAAISSSSVSTIVASRQLNAVLPPLGSELSVRHFPVTHRFLRWRGDRRTAHGSGNSHAIFCRLLVITVALGGFDHSLEGFFNLPIRGPPATHARKSTSQLWRAVGRLFAVLRGSCEP
jgi:hypothetical protein